MPIKDGDEIKVRRAKQKTTRIALVVDKDEATHRALTRIGEQQGFLVGGFTDYQDFAAWFDDQCAFPTVSNFVCCFILDVNLTSVLASRKLPSVLYDIPKIYTGAPNFSCELTKLTSLGFFDFLEKPFTLKRLGERLNAGFSQHAKILKGVERTAQRYSRLSRREYSVGSLVVDGLTNQQIADKLCIAVKTVKSHRGRLMQKTESKSLVDLVRFFDSHSKLS